MIEKVARLVDKDFVYKEGFVSFLVSQMSRELADRVMEKIVNDGECICTYKGVESLDYPETEQVEMRSGIDIRPLIRCKDCEYNNRCMYQSFVRDNTLKPMSIDDWFCPDGKEVKHETTISI